MAVTDTVLAGRLGAIDLAAIALGTPLWFPAFLGCLGILTALTPSVAQLAGAGRSMEIPAVFRQALWLAVGLGVIAGPLVFQLASAPRLLGVDPAIIPVTHGYVAAIATGMPAACVFLVFRFLAEGLGDTRPTMYVQLAALGLNGILDYGLMFGKLGFPALGAVGAGWATAIVFWVQMTLMAVYVVRLARRRNLRLLNAIDLPRVDALLDLLRVGVPVSGTILMEVGLFAVITLLMGRLGTVAIAAHQIALNYASVMFMVPLAISIATSVRVGHQVGAGRLDRARVTGWVGIAMASGFMTASAMFILFAPDWIVGAYTGEPEVADLAAGLLFFAAVFQLFDGIQVAAAGALRGFKDTLVPLALTFVAYWIAGLPVAVVLAFVLQQGPRGLWAGLAAGLGLAAAMLVRRFQRVASGAPDPAPQRASTR